MRVVLQRVQQASVSVGGEPCSEIGRGLLLLVGIGRNDTTADLSWMSRKIPQLRIFEDDASKMNLSLRDVGGSILAVSQFTLYGDVSRGNRPGFSGSAPFDEARVLFDRFVELLRQEARCRIETGSFGSDMQVSLVNDGPVTLILESPQPS